MLNVAIPATAVNRSTIYKEKGMNAYIQHSSLKYN